MGFRPARAGRIDAWRGLAKESGLVVHDLDTPEFLEGSIVHRDVDLTPAARAFLLLSGAQQKGAPTRGREAP